MAVGVNLRYKNCKSPMLGEGHEQTRAMQQKSRYSITVLAVASSDGEIVRPSTLALLRLMISS